MPSDSLRLMLRIADDRDAAYRCREPDIVESHDLHPVLTGFIHQGIDFLASRGGIEAAKLEGLGMA